MKEKSATYPVELFAVGEPSVLKAEKRVIACQACSPAVSRAFGSVLIEVLGVSTGVSDFVLSRPGRCPNCAKPIFENTLVRCEGELDIEEQRPLFEYWAPDPDQTNVVLVDESLLHEGEAFISGCEHCVANAEMTFEYIFDALTEFDPTVTEYVLCHPAKCPCCGGVVTEKTLVVAP